MHVCHQAEERSALTTDMLALTLSENIWTYVVVVHDHQRFINIMGLGAEFTGQFFLDVRWEIRSKKKI